MLKLEVIEESTNPWGSPPLLGPKPDGSVNFCIDFQKLYSVYTFDAYSMPQMDALLDVIGGAQVLFMIDLMKGYWQIPLAPAAMRKGPLISSPVFIISLKCHLACMGHFKGL